MNSKDNVNKDTCSTCIAINLDPRSPQCKLYLFIRDLERRPTAEEIKAQGIVEIQPNCPNGFSL